MHVPHTLSHDVFMLQKFGTADKETLLGYVSMEDRMTIMGQMAREKLVTNPSWCAVPLVIIGQLMYKVSVFV